jgi:hypothetical protein
MRALIACLLVSTTGCAQGGEDFHHVHAHAWRGVPPPRRHLVARSTTVVDLDLGTGFVIASELRLSMYVHTAKQIYQEGKDASERESRSGCHILRRSYSIVPGSVSPTNWIVLSCKIHVKMPFSQTEYLWSGTPRIEGELQLLEIYHGNLVLHG